MLPAQEHRDRSRPSSVDPVAARRSGGGEGPEAEEALDALDDVEELEVALEAAPARGWERRPFAPGTSQLVIETAYETGGLHVVAGPATLAVDEVLLAVWSGSGTLDLAPRHRDVGDGEVAVVAGGTSAPDA